MEIGGLATEAQRTEEVGIDLNLGVNEANQPFVGPSIRLNFVI